MAHLAHANRVQVASRAKKLVDLSEAIEYYCTYQKMKEDCGLRQEVFIIIHMIDDYIFITHTFISAIIRKIYSSQLLTILQSSR